MTIQTYNQDDCIIRIADRLADQFIQPLLKNTGKINYAKQVGGLYEILIWAREFHDKYQTEIYIFEISQKGDNDILKTREWNDRILAFGQKKLDIFYTRIRNHSGYFLESYTAVAWTPA